MAKIELQENVVNFIISVLKHADSHTLTLVGNDLNIKVSSNLVMYVMNDLANQYNASLKPPESEKPNGTATGKSSKRVSGKRSK